MTQEQEPLGSVGRGPRRRVLTQIIALVVVALVVGGVALVTQYRTGIEQQRERLSEVAQSQARLIEAAGLKGFSIGGAEVSGKHANFIINKNDATATDIEELIEHVRQKVIEVHGIALVHEVRIVGEAAQ